MRPVPLGVLVLALATPAVVVPQDDGDLGPRLAQIGARVQEYFARAQSIMYRETVRLQPLRRDFMPDGFSRELVYEARVTWTPSDDGQEPPSAQIVRTLLTVNGRPPKPGDEPACTDPKSLSPEPLAMLLPGRQRDYTFEWDGTTRVDDRNAVRLEYQSTLTDAPVVTWQDDCATVDLPGLVRGRLWADRETGEILRFDENLSGWFEFPVPRRLAQVSRTYSMVIERSDTSIRYKPVTFADPEETVLLPARVETLTIVQNAGTPRLRTTQVFSDYQRFIAAGRIVNH